MPLTQLTILFSFICLTILIWRTWKAHAALLYTTLIISWRWAIVAEAACWLTCLASLTTLHPAVLDQLWYFTAILILCPFISVLGARSPTHRVWSWFIILPLIAVLGWPALTLHFERSELPRLILQAPGTIGFFLALTMGLGNYLGTRFGNATFWVGAAVVCLITSCTSMGHLHPERIVRFRAIGSLCFTTGIWIAFRHAAWPTVEENRFDRLWFDFRDTFGIVWSIRIQERINQTAETEKWLTRLGPDGFHWQNLPVADAAEIAQLNADTEAKMEHTLRWLFRRFVEPQFIDERLNS